MFADTHTPTQTETGEAEGENYFISMTDMMVGVLFIFVIMLMTFALDFQKTTDIQQSSINVAQQVALKLQAMQADVRDKLALMDRANQARRQLLADIQTQLAAEGLIVDVDEANGVLRLTENAVKFDANHSDLSDKAKLNVDKIAHALDRVLANYTACKVTADQPTCAPAGSVGPTLETVFIEGHTDTTGVPDLKERDKRNWELSAERAVATYREIVAQSPGLRSLRNKSGEEIVSVSGYSSTRPIDPRETREAWERNRRIDLRFVMEVDTKEGLQQILSLTNTMKTEIDHMVDASAHKAALAIVPADTPVSTVPATKSDAIRPAKTQAPAVTPSTPGTN
jgi:flagellar motor protein MotB